MEIKYSQNAKYLIMAFIGLIMTCLGYLTYLFNPQESIVNAMTVLEPDTILFKLWEQPPLDIFAKVYIFNVTNSEEFLAGKEKLRVEEIGPYTYREILKNTEAVFNDNDTVTYKPVREYIFQRDLSVGDPMTDTVFVPNIPLLGMGSYLSSFNIFVRLGFNAMTSSTKPFLNLTVNEYLWGYEDRLVTLASTFVPNWIDFTTFGIMDRLMRRDAGNTITIYSKRGTDAFDNLVLPYSMASLNGSPGLKQWNYEEPEGNETIETNTACNTITGNFDGGLFPRNLEQNDTLTVYRPAFCRPVRFSFENESINEDGFPIYNYRVANDFLESGDTNPDNKCYCVNGKCLPDGFNTLSPCYYGIPITISQPHYLNADEKISSQVEGLHPDALKHDITAQINPNVGIPVSAHLRMQVNLYITENSFTSVKKFSNLMLPLVWVELELNELTGYCKFLLNMIIRVLPITQTVIMWLLGIFGLALIAAAALIIFYFPPERRLDDPYGHRIGYSPILVIPLTSRLKEARIS